jgi:hypothetical protein
MQGSRFLLIMLLLAAGIICGVAVGLAVNLPLIEEIISVNTQESAPLPTYPLTNSTTSGSGSNPAALSGGAGTSSVASAGVSLEPGEYAEVVRFLQQNGSSWAEVAYPDGTLNPEVWERFVEAAKLQRVQELYQLNYR